MCLFTARFCTLDQTRDHRTRLLLLDPRVPEPDWNQGCVATSLRQLPPPQHEHDRHGERHTPGNHQRLSSKQDVKMLI